MSERLKVHEQETPVDNSLAEHARDRHEAIIEKLDRKAEQSNETRAESARHELESIKHEQEKRSAEKESRVHEKETAKRPERITKNAKKAAYNRTMKDVRRDLPATSRAYSSFIHNRAVEKTSEVLGDTVLRPNAILSAAVTAFVVVSVLYIVARHFGYPLSGFETIGAMIIGWIVGTMFDFVKIMVTGKK